MIRWYEAVDSARRVGSTSRLISLGKMLSVSEYSHGEAALRLSTELNLKPKCAIGKFDIYFCFHANVFSASTVDERKQTSREAQDVLLRGHQLGTRIPNV